MSILTKIRQRPDNEKKVFSLVSAGVLTVIIFGVWFSATSDSSEAKAESESKLSSISPVQVIKEEFSKAISSFKEDTESPNEEIATSSPQASTTIPIEIIESTSTTN
jgi:hypothetical protein